MEYLVVLYPRKRRVFINGQVMGLTNKVLELQSGQYEVALGPPANFKPGTIPVDLSHTAVSSPKIVEFEEDKP